MKQNIPFLAVAGAVVLSATASAQDFTNSGAFLGAINSSYYYEAFTGWSYGSPIGSGSSAAVTYVGPGANGFDWTAIGGTGVPNSGQNLWSQAGGVSTDADQISITFSFSNSTNAVSAFGGNFQDTDSSGSNESGSLVLNFMNGASVVHTTTLTNDTSSSFYGYVSNTAFTSVVITVPTTDEWAYAGSLYTGAAVSTPEPASLAVLGLAGLALMRRRRSR